MKEILIIGAGASGIAAAITAAENPNCRVTILERLPRVGKKLLATGNGRCNLTNREISPDRYHTDTPQRLASLLSQLPAEMALSFFRQLGLLCTEEDQGRVYPYSHQATTVLDVLLRGLNHKNIRIFCDCKVDSVTKSKMGFLISAGDRQFHADAVILAAGGCAAPRQGTDGSGYTLAQSLGHRCSPVYPALVALQCKHPALSGLKGIRAHGCVELQVQGRTVANRTGEIQFADYGLSGIPVFDLSCYLKSGFEKAELVADLLPELSVTALQSRVNRERREQSQVTLEQFLCGTVHKKLLYAAMKQAGCSPLSRKVSTITDEEAFRLCTTLKGWHFPVLHALSWEQAQVTGGGVSLTEINDDFSSRKCRELYLTGEVLDVAGDCGGYNLHWAWCSGIRAGLAAANTFD